jgi:hypothetical protein
MNGMIFWELMNALAGQEEEGPVVACIPAECVHDGSNAYPSARSTMTGSMRVVA